MRRVLAVISCAILVLFVTPVALAAQAGTIRGRVADSAGAPLARASVSVEGTHLGAATDAQGAYTITGVPAGTYTMRARVLGYLPITARVTLAAGEVRQQNFTLPAQPIALSPIDVVVGSRARHTAAEELAVPVDIFFAEVLTQQGTSETAQILQALSPSINFPRQTITDANDIVRPFTLRGLSPDHTLVLINGARRHQMAVVNTFSYGMGAGSSGVDLNAIPSSAIDRIEVLRDGASAQYGSDAIAGVVNVVLKEGRFTPFLNASSGRYITDDYPDDGTTVNVNGGWGIGLGRGSLALFGEFLDRQPTNRAWADPFEESVTGEADVIDSQGRVVAKRNPIPQPNHHWGDGFEKDVLTMANFRLPLTDARTSELYAFGGYSFRQGTGNGYRRYTGDNRNWPEIYPLGFLPEFNPDVTDYSAAGGFRAATGGWSLDLGASFGHNGFEYNLRNTLNVSLGPCLDVACAPGPDGTPGTGDEMPNQTSFFAGAVEREEFSASFTAARELELGLPAPVHVAVGAAFRRERFEITPGERASWINGGHLPQDSAGADGIFGNADDKLDPIAGSQVFTGFAPTDSTNESRTNFGVFLELETKLSPQFLANVAGRFESYSDFGERVTGKVAFRYQPSARVTFRAAGSTGFRAPGISQSHHSHVSTNFVFDPTVGRPVPLEVGEFPVGHPASRALGATPLDEETSLNFSGGVAVSPQDNLTITADYFYIKIDDRILFGAQFDDDATVQILTDEGFDDIAGVKYFTNGLDTRTQGVDVTGNLRVPAGAGTFGLTGALNYTKNEITRVDPLPQVLRDAGSTEPGLIDSVTYIGITEERPDWRATVTAEYSVGRVHSLARASYYGRFASANPGFCDECRESYGAKTLFDAEVGYRFDQVDLSIGLRNLFDTYPDQASETNSFGIFPWAAASPFGYNGRYIYARAAVQLRP